MKRVILPLVFLVFFANSAFALERPAKKKPKIRIKIATLAPPGSYEKLNQWIQEATNYEVGLKFYYGGIQGDAKDVLRKIRFKQLQGATLSGYGLGQIVPESRVTNIPYLFRNYQEVHYVRSHLQDYMNERFREKGFTVLGWYDVGFIYTFSKVPITSLEVAREQKFWIPENDQVAVALCKALDISPVSLSITDVMTSLSTRLIDAASAPPIAAVAFRWYSRFQYMSEYPMGNVISALVVTKKKWKTISSESREKILKICGEFFLKAQDVINKKNKKSVALLKKAGIRVVRVNSKEYKDLIAMMSQKTTDALVGRMFSRDLLNKTLGLLKEYRDLHPGSSVEKIE